MKIGVITVRDHLYHPNKRLQEAGEKRGHHVDLIHPYQIWPFLEKGDASLVSAGSTQLPDVVIPRQGAEVGDACLALVRQFQLLEIPVVNTIDSIMVARNQFVTLQHFAAAGIPFPNTVFINNADGLYPAVEKLGGFPVVIKQVSGRQGHNIFLAGGREDAETIINRHLDTYFGLLIQQFIYPETRKDIRVMIVGQEVIGAMAMTPNDGDFRANFHLTGKGVPVSLTSDQRKIALRSADVIGLEIAGVDLMVSDLHGIQVIEANYAPGFQGLEAATGVDAASQIIQYAIKRHHK